MQGLDCDPQVHSISAMSARAKTSRAQVWLDGPADWSWPGRAAVAVEALPPAWVPAFPPRREPAPLPALAPGNRSRAIRYRRAAWGLLLVAVVFCAALALSGPLRLERALGLSHADVAANRVASQVAGTRALEAPAQPLPTLTLAGEDTAGSSIEAASYPSSALNGQGSFLVYLPAGYASTTQHYPVLYLLHGNGQSDGSFLDIGLQGTLDRLIARHVIPPMIAVMIQGGPGANNWRNVQGGHYETYVLEVQDLIDRMLPTVPSRGDRAIVGYSMGGYGAMNLALSHPGRFAVAESWLGFFNGLEGKLKSDRPLLRRAGLRAFLYGGESDDIANPSENAPFAAALRAAGASARSAVYPGGHSFETLEAHLASMLAFVGRGFRADAASNRN
jgi:enterochelin esterase-like enzyme